MAYRFILVYEHGHKIDIDKLSKKYIEFWEVSLVVLTTPLLFDRAVKVLTITLISPRQILFMRSHCSSSVSRMTLTSGGL
jgi:hypothetical protein